MTALVSFIFGACCGLVYARGRGDAFADLACTAATLARRVRGYLKAIIDRAREYKSD